MMVCGSRTAPNRRYDPIPLRLKRGCDTIQRSRVVRQRVAELSQRIVHLRHVRGKQGGILLDRSGMCQCPATGTGGLGSLIALQRME